MYVLRNVRVHGHVTRVLKFYPNHNFGVGESVKLGTSKFKYRVLIDTEV